MAFSAYNTRDCRGPSGLAMTDCVDFLKTAGAVSFATQKITLLNQRIQPGAK